MTTNIQAIQFSRTGDYDRNSRKAGSAEPCFRCGRPIRNEGRFVHLRTDGMIVPTDATLTDTEDQGWFAIGPECATRIPANYSTTASTEGSTTMTTDQSREVPAAIQTAAMEWRHLRGEARKAYTTYLDSLVDHKDAATKSRLNQAHYQAAQQADQAFARLQAAISANGTNALWNVSVKSGKVSPTRESARRREAWASFQARQAAEAEGHRVVRVLCGPKWALPEVDSQDNVAVGQPVAFTHRNDPRSYTWAAQAYGTPAPTPDSTEGTDDMTSATTPDLRKFASRVDDDTILALMGRMARNGQRDARQGDMDGLRSMIRAYNTYAAEALRRGLVREAVITDPASPDDTYRIANHGTKAAPILYVYSSRHGHDVVLDHVQDVDVALRGIAELMLDARLCMATNNQFTCDRPKGHDGDHQDVHSDAPNTVNWGPEATDALASRGIFPEGPDHTHTPIPAPYGTGFVVCADCQVVLCDCGKGEWCPEYGEAIRAAAAYSVRNADMLNDPSQARSTLQVADTEANRVLDLNLDRDDVAMAQDYLARMGRCQACDALFGNAHTDDCRFGPGIVGADAMAKGATTVTSGREYQVTYQGREGVGTFTTLDDAEDAIRRAGVAGSNVSDYEILERQVSVIVSGWVRTPRPVQPQCLARRQGLQCELSQGHSGGHGNKDLAGTWWGDRESDQDAPSSPQDGPSDTEAPKVTWHTRGSQRGQWYAWDGSDTVATASRVRALGRDIWTFQVYGHGTTILEGQRATLAEVKAAVADALYQ